MPLRNNGQDFEYRVYSLFDDLGFPIFETKQSHDYGADLLLHFNGQEVAIQCKDQNAPVGVSAVQEAVAAVAYYHADCAAVFTSSTFTRPARKLAEANHVALIDGYLLEMLEDDGTGELEIFSELISRPEKAPAMPEQKQGMLSKLKGLFA